MGIGISKFVAEGLALGFCRIWIRRIGRVWILAA